MEALKDSALRVLPGDEHPEALRAGGEARHVRSLGATGLERQVGDSPEFTADKCGPHFSHLATDLHPQDILDTHRRNRAEGGPASWRELNT